MKKLIFLLLALPLFFVSCDLVKPNNVGVLMENYGKNGKEDFSLVKGRVNTMAPGTQLYQVPLWEQREEFGDRVLHLKSADNTDFTCKPMYSYRVVEKRAIDVVFENKQLDSGDDFMKSVADNILEPHIYDLMKEEIRRFPTDALMAEGGSLKFEDAIQKIVAVYFENKGFELLSFSCQLEFTDKVKEKIDSRNEVNTNISVLDQQIQEQKKRNELEELITQQNIIRSRGLTPQILQLEYIKALKTLNQPIYGNVPISFVKQ